MDRSLEDRLSGSLREAFHDRCPLIVRVEGEGFDIVDREGALVLSVSPDLGKWLVERGNGHAHLEDFDEAVDLVLALLYGKARFASEFRGEKHASSWIETFDGKAYEVGHQAVYLSPFDEDEWSTEPGEEWRVVRQTLRLGVAWVTEESFERRSEGPTFGVPASTGWIKDALGQPLEGMRWSVGGYRRFVFQVPRGWRLRNQADDEEQNFSDYGPASGTLIFRAFAHFRNADSPSERVDRSVRPASVEYKLEEPDESNPYWVTHTWTLLFSDGPEQMLGMLQLFHTNPAPDSVESLVGLIQRSASEARFVPHDWDMSNEKDG